MYDREPQDAACPACPLALSALLLFTPPGSRSVLHGVTTFLSCPLALGRSGSVSHSHWPEEEAPLVSCPRVNWVSNNSEV